MNGTIAVENDILTQQEMPIVPTNPAKTNEAPVQNHRQEEREVARRSVVTAKIIADSRRMKSALIMPKPSMRLRKLRLAPITVVHVTNTRAKLGHGVRSEPRYLSKRAAGLLADQ